MCCASASAAWAQQWACYGGSAQHRSIAPASAQPLNRVLWSTPVDLDPQYGPEGILYAHYGSPVITAKNTILVPVKKGAYDGFRIEARNGSNGALLYNIETDYSTVSASGWIASFGPALGKDGSIFVPGAGGTVFIKKDSDKAAGGPIRSVFYGGPKYTAAIPLYSANVKICTPLTVDGKNNAWFGFRMYGETPDESPVGVAGLVSGIARVDANGVGDWRSARSLTGDPEAMRVQFQCAPAISDDNSTVYFAVQVRNGGGYLVGVDTQTLKTKYRVRLIDPYSGADAIISNMSTSSPTIGLDGDVFFGILSNPQEAHNKRGYLLHFDKTLSTQKITGSFGWDSTASIFPTSTLKGYKGKSSYLLITKYNNYALFGDGINRVALLDPNETVQDAITDVGVMNDLVSIAGPTLDPRWAGPDYPDACYEWCVNAAAVDVAGHCALVNSEDGMLYRWDLLTNKLSEGVMLDGPRGQAYTPTIVGPTGVVYAINNARLFAVGK